MKKLLTLLFFLGLGAFFASVMGMEAKDKNNECVGQAEEIVSVAYITKLNTCPHGNKRISRVWNVLESEKDLDDLLKNGKYHFSTEEVENLEQNRSQLKKNDEIEKKQHVINALSVENIESNPQRKNNEDEAYIYQIYKKRKKEELKEQQEDNISLEEENNSLEDEKIKFEEEERIKKQKKEEQEKKDKEELKEQEEKKKMGLLIGCIATGISSGVLFIVSWMFTIALLLVLIHRLIQGLVTLQVVAKVVAFLEQRGFKVQGKVTEFLEKLSEKMRNARWFNFMRKNDKLTLTALIFEIGLNLFCIGVGATTSFVAAGALGIVSVTFGVKYLSLDSQT